MIEKTLKACLKAGVVPYFQGPPGIGKTQQIRQFCRENGLDLIIFESATREYTDLLGIPFPDREKGVTEWLTPSEFPRSGKGIFFLDDLPAASPEMQPALFRFLLERQIGEYRLPDGWHIVAAGNRPDDQAGSGLLNTAIINRLAVFDLKADLQSWLDWSKGKVNGKIRYFLSQFPEFLHQIPETNNGDPFPSPRSWDAASRLIESGLSPQQAVMACCGEKATTEYTLWLKSAKDLPSVNDIMNNPEGCNLPDGVETQLRLIKSLTSPEMQTFAAAQEGGRDALEKFVGRMHPEPRLLYRQKVKNE